MKLNSKVYNPQLREEIIKVNNNCNICSGGKYYRNNIKNIFHITETPQTTNEIIHVDTYSRHLFMVFIEKFSKHATCLPLTDRNSITLIAQIPQFVAIKGKVKKMVFDTEFNNENVREFLNKEGIEYHINIES